MVNDKQQYLTKLNALQLHLLEAAGHPIEIINKLKKIQSSNYKRNLK